MLPTSKSAVCPRTGAEIAVCIHGSELCGICCMDFVEMNEEARENVINSKCGEEDLPGYPVSKQLKKGTKLICIDRSGRNPPEHSPCVIVGSKMGVEFGMSFPAYVIKFECGEHCVVDISDVHDPSQYKIVK
eukprot:Nk52_evm15s224 gene=Nk52_evmTU15s224